VVHKGFSPIKGSKKGYTKDNQKKNSNLGWALIKYATPKVNKKGLK
jgi:hypothetical protein